MNYFPAKPQPQQKPLTIIERIERHLFADMQTKNLVLWRTLFSVLGDLRQLKNKKGGKG